MADLRALVRPPLLSGRLRPVPQLLRGQSWLVRWRLQAVLLTVLPAIQACAVLAPSDPANPPLGLRRLDEGYEIVIPLCGQDRAESIYLQEGDRDELTFEVGDSGVQSRVEDDFQYLSISDESVESVNEFDLQVSSDQRTWLERFRREEIDGDINGGIQFDYQNVTLGQLRQAAENSDCWLGRVPWMWFRRVA